MKNLTLKSSLILLFLYFIKLPTIIANDVVIARAQALLSKNSIASMPYCSGYHCYHQAMDTCERIGEKQCRVAEIGNLNTVVSGHGNVVLRIPLGINDFYCLADPQRYARRITADFCWSLGSSQDPPNSYWYPPESVQLNYCRKRKLGCDSSGQVIFRIRKSIELEGSPYEAWWKNKSQSAGQIYKICEHKNKSINLGRLPLSMPACETLVNTRCNSSGHAFACNYGGFCQVVHCDQSSRLTWTTHENLPLPTCESGALTSYCSDWSKSIRRTAEARVQDYFIYFNTQHFCRNNSREVKFWCHPSGPIFGGKGLRNEL